jgi:hypothetical protein
LLDAAYVPSLWAVQKTVLMVLLGICPAAALGRRDYFSQNAAV